MVGESGLLSAAQCRLLQSAPEAVRFVEGNYGRWLLADDLTRPSPRFGYGGRLRAPSGPGLGVTVDAGKLARYGRLVASLRT
jgi:glucarate dehydratase